MKLNNNVYLIVAYCHKQGQQLCIIYFLSSPLVGKRDIVVTILVRCMCVRLSDLPLYNNAWISKQFGPVVALEKKCHLKHSLGRLKVKVTGVK